MGSLLINPFLNALQNFFLLRAAYRGKPRGLNPPPAFYVTIDPSTTHARQGIPGSTFSHGEKLTLPALWQRQQQGAASAMQTTSLYGCSLRN